MRTSFTRSAPVFPFDRERSVAWAATLPGGIALALAALVVGTSLSLVPGVRALDLAVLDHQFALLARAAPLPAADDIAIVGIDEATLAATPEPQSLLHRTLGRALAGLAQAAPRAVGIDVVLPSRSFDAYAPGSDAALIAGLLRLRREAPIVLSMTTAADGTVRAIHPPFVAASGDPDVAFALLPVDDDGRVRRFDDRLGAHGEQVPTLVGRLAALGGVAVKPGLIQYALGRGFDYVRLIDVAAAADTGDQAFLRRNLGGRIVLIGPVLAHEDRLRQPVALARWESTLEAPGVLVHAQALRTQLANASIRRAPLPLQGAALALAAALWLVPTSRSRIGALALYLLASFALSLALLRSGVELPFGAPARVALVATLGRSALDAWRGRRDRARLTTLFGGYVSPAVMASILSGAIDADAQRGRRPGAFLFADIRDFTAMSEAAAPEVVLDRLNRYFAAMTPVLHEHGATIDNFRGDGLMAIFGAPNALPDAASAAVRAARGMFARLDALNRELAGDHLAPIAIGVTIAYGEAIVGHVGSPQRHNYTAIGDAANVAARLQDATKASGFALIATAEVVARARGAAAADWTSLGEVAIRGHAPVLAYGWRPA